MSGQATYPRQDNEIVIPIPILHDAETAHKPRGHEDAGEDEGHRDADEDALIARWAPVVVQKHYG